MRVLKGSSNPRLSDSIASELGADTVLADIRRFPDGEIYARVLEPLDGEDVVIVQSTYPDHNAMEMFILSQLVSDLGAGSVWGVVPYFGYARQDRVFNEGESFTARTMARHLQMSLDHVICVNLHKETILDHFTDVKSRVNLSVMGDIGAFLKEMGVDFVLSPDAGAVDYAREAASEAGVPFDHLEKRRLDGETVSMKPKNLDVDGRNVAIVDDIIATGGTILRAQETLREQGAEKVYACCAHGLFTGGGIERLTPHLDGLFSSDTIENPTTRISAGRVIARYIEDTVG
ncbi:ribose-phosphate pyrophosphokinase [Thermoplasmatales archaeon ex4484_6]|nr:MAG: ribose-phosphate pyrophosphokinase [Thermoplasmatales archaeon ex4484_6]